MTQSEFHTIGPWPASKTDTDVLLAGVLLIDAEGCVCLQLRDDYAHITAPGKWSFFGGHVDPGEMLIDAAVRELFEETGIKTTAQNLQPFARTLTPNGAQMNIFRLTTPVQRSDITLGEGAGFAFINARQRPRFITEGPALRILTHYFDTYPTPH